MRKEKSFMRKMRKRAMSFVVSVSLVVGLVPLPSMAATPESKEEDPFASLFERKA